MNQPLPTADTRIGVLVADSTPLTARLLADVLRRDRGLTVNDANPGSVLTAAATLKPDVTVLSENMQSSQGEGFHLLRQLRRAVPSTRVIMLLDSDERDLVVESFRSGARGVFSRNDPVKLLNKCVHKVSQGQLWATSSQLEYLLDALANAPTTQLVDTNGTKLLSKREEDVVRWLSEGLTNSEIAREMNLSENTVKNYLFRIFNKLGVSSRVELVIYAANHKAASELPQA